MAQRATRHGAYDPSLLAVLAAEIEPRTATAQASPIELLVPLADLQSGYRVAAPIESAAVRS